MASTFDGAGDAPPSYVGALISAGVRVERGESWEQGSEGAPARPAVIALEDAEGRTVLLGTTGDAREFLRARCVAPAGGKRADLGGVVSGAFIVPVTSGFEAELVYMALARARTPGAAVKLAARQALWVVRLDASASFPEPTVLPLSGARGCDATGLFGPVVEQGAPRLAEAVVDAFDLCRYPSVLKQAPRGAACAYKEMGRCPAPCDGSEPMESYRARVRTAVERMSCAPAAREAGITAGIKEAAADARFEEAAALKKVLDRVRSLDTGVKGVGTLDRFRNIVVWGIPGRTAVRVTGWAGGALVGRVDVTVKQAAETSGLVQAVGAAPVRVPDAAAELDALGAVFRWGMKPPGRRRMRVVRLDGVDDAGLVVGAVKSVGRVSAAAEAEVVEETEHAEEAG